MKKFIQFYQTYQIYIYIFILAFMQSFYFLNFDESICIKTIYCISTFSFLVVMRSIGKQIFNVCVVFGFIVTCFVFSALKTYGKIDINYITSVFYSTPGEAASYFHMTPWEVLVSLPLLGIFTVFILKNKQIIKLKKRFKILCMVIVLLFPITKHTSSPTKNENIYKYVSVPFLKYPAEVGKYYKEILKKVHYKNLQDIQKEDTWEIDNNSISNTKPKTIILVIGESVNKNFLHSYGFPIKNTPFIDSSKNIQFENYTSVAAYTVPSLLRTIAFAPKVKTYQIHNNIISLVKKIGFSTYWISNQGEIGPASFIGKEANNSYFLKTEKQDTDMLPIVDTILQDSSKQRFIVLHMVGSHPYSCDRTEGKYDEFIKSKDISCYNKSIKNLDAFLQELHGKLETTNQDFSLIYFSDHGLKLNDTYGVLHGGDSQGGYEAPFVVWEKDLKESKKIEAKRNGKDFLHFFSEILDVNIKNIDKEYKFISEEDNGEEITEIIQWDHDNGSKIITIDYETLKDFSIESLFVEDK